MNLLFLKRRNNLASRIRRIASASLISYLRLAEASGSVAADASGHGYTGAYTGVALGQSAGFAHPVPLFDGATSYVNWYSAGLAGAFNGAEGTLSIGIQVLNAGVWSDGISRYAAQIRADINNRLSLSKSPTTNFVTGTYNAGGVSKSVSGSASSTGVLQLAFTWSKAADKAILYVNGVQSGATLTGLGTWAGLPAATVTTVGAASNVPASVWSGWLGDAFVCSRALTAAEIAAIYAGGKP